MHLAYAKINWKLLKFYITHRQMSLKYLLKIFSYFSFMAVFLIFCYILSFFLSFFFLMFASCKVPAFYAYLPFLFRKSRRYHISVCVSISRGFHLCLSSQIPFYQGTLSLKLAFQAFQRKTVS